MKKVTIEKVKANLLSIKIKILNGGVLTKSDDLHISSDDLADEADLASNIINQQVSFNMREREISKLRAIEDALSRLEEGGFGHCEECDEEIAEKRLMNQPWTTLCITHAEELERENRYPAPRAI